jgi:hypothetical protein
MPSLHFLFALDDIEMRPPNTHEGSIAGWNMSVPQMDRFQPFPQFSFYTISTKNVHLSASAATKVTGTGKGFW